MSDDRLTVHITGMHCSSCASKIEDALGEVAGVDVLSVSARDGEAEIRVDADLDESALREAVSGAGDYRVESLEPAGESSETSRESGGATDSKEGESLYPLFLIVGFIAGVVLLIGIATGTWGVETQMRHFMAGFFIVFAFFKLLDLPGFVNAYRGYDLLARKLPAWGWAYPFVELGLGVAYLLNGLPLVTNAVTLVLMLVGAAGVLRALLDRRSIQCACLGTALSLPMTRVTLIEDLTMAAMAAVMLGIRLL